MVDSGSSPGWYTGDDGVRRYWDGQQWLTPSDGPSRPRRRGWAGLVGGIVVVTVGVAVALTVSSRQDDQRKESAAAETRASAAASASAAAEQAEIQRGIRERAAERERQEAEQKADAAKATDERVNRLSGETWTPVISGELYVRPARNDEFTCGAYDCTSYVVFSVPGCPGGVYVEAAIENNGTVVGYTNNRLGALEPAQQGQAILEDVQGAGGTFRLSQATCYP